MAEVVDIKLNTSAYGWWVTDKGKIEEVAFEAHYAAIDAGRVNGGWVRVVNGGGRLEIDLWMGQMTPQTFSALLALIDHPRWEDFGLDHITDSLRTYDVFTDRKRLQLRLRKMTNWKVEEN